MASANFTIDDTSPLIQYVGIWGAGTNVDPLKHLRVTLNPVTLPRLFNSDLCRYSNGGTFTLCNTLGSSATFTFNGTQVYVYGAKRDNHGPYSVTLDGTTTAFNGFSETALWTTLFVSDVLAQGMHTITITWTSNVAEQGETPTIEDTANGFSYEPKGAWGTDLEAAVLSGFSSGSGHVTFASGAFASLTFKGDVVTIFGAVGPSIAPYSVQLDGVFHGKLNATKPLYTPQVALYHANNLGTGLHTLVLTSQPAEREVLAIDYAQVAAVSQPSARVGSANKRQSVIGPAVGGVVGGVTFLGFVILVLYVAQRRAHRARQRNGMLAVSQFPHQLHSELNTASGGQRGKGTAPETTQTVRAPPLTHTYSSRREPDDRLLGLPPDYAQATMPERSVPRW
ncbi:hypothetical protein B0H16DRAFT_1469726 [Mycena metata]|uniref:Transmembrane protein n=1 Tax=Mycena metata TaxID=1033252 RepID=A0AAD7HWY9_9AGAR|nr:hypothetical protein B0H16DRAFT_1469726 [Mycena metata]